jgi:hypothetical protein
VLLLAPGEPSDAATAATAIELADQAVRGTESHRYYWYFQVCKGFAEYRAGRFDESLRWLDKAGAAAMPDAPAFHMYLHAVRAMAEYRLGRDPQARLSLEEARRAMAKCPDPARGNAYAGSDWHDWIIGRTLLREAEALVGRGGNGGRVSQ